MGICVRLRWTAWLTSQNTPSHGVLYTIWSLLVTWYEHTYGHSSEEWTLIARLSTSLNVIDCYVVCSRICDSLLVIQWLWDCLISLTTHSATLVQKRNFSNRHSKGIFITPTGSKNYNDDPTTTRRCEMLDDRSIYWRYDTTPALDGGTDWRTQMSHHYRVSDTDAW